MTTQPLDEVGATDDDTRLRTAEELVPGEADEIGSRAEALGGRGLVSDARERTRAEIVDERQLVCASDRSELGELGRSENPTTRKFDWCTRSSTAVSGPIARS